MHSGSSVHHSGHQHRLVASEGYKVHEPRVEQMPRRLLDSPYADFYKKSNSFAYGPDVDYNRHAKYKVYEEDEDADAKADEFIKGKHTFGVVDYNQRAKFKVKEEEEIVDTEAGEFIKHEHEKFLRQKTMASFR